MAPCLLPKISRVEVNNFGVKYAKFGVFANPVHLTSQEEVSRRSCAVDVKEVY